MTLFASHLARLQAHLESMTVPQRANVIKHLYDKLEKWRGSWVMALTSVSRDRADRLWALLVTYQGEPGCIEDKDAKWADDRWEELVAMLQIDAVQAADIGAFRLPGTLVEIDDSQAGAPSSSSNQVMVRRTEHGPWEQATDREVKELAQKDEDDALLRRQQEAHDEALWQEHQAAKAQEWDDWAVASEMGKTRSMQSPRPAKRFRVRVSVFDKDHNELDTADLHGDIDANDQPLVSFTVMEEEVNRTPDDVEGPADEAEGEKAKADEGEEQGKGADQDQDGDGRCDQADQAETEAVASAEGDVDELVDPDIAGLGSVDSVMVSKRWGQRVLEIFEVNRAMMELDEDGPRGEDERHLPPGHPRSSATRQRDSGGRRSPRVDEWQEGHGARDEQEGPGLHRAAPGFGEAAADDLKVRRFSEDSQDSQGSSGAKVFPEREIVAGNRKAEDREDDMELAQAVVDGGPDSIEQQELLDTQLDGPGDPMPWTLSHLARLLMWWLQ
ncbi:unnamed protein product, partial [Symbiodinium pilosum]